MGTKHVSVCFSASSVYQAARAAKLFASLLAPADFMQTEIEIRPTEHSQYFVILLFSRVTKKIGGKQ